MYQALCRGSRSAARLQPFQPPVAPVASIASCHQLQPTLRLIPGAVSAVRGSRISPATGSAYVGFVVLSQPPGGHINGGISIASFCFKQPGQAAKTLHLLLPCQVCVPVVWCPFVYVEHTA